MTLKFFLLFLFSFSVCYADKDDDAVQALCLKHSHEFTPAGIMHPGLEWIDFFTKKAHGDIRFADTNKTTLEALMVRGAGFGGIDYTQEAPEEISKTWIYGLQLVFQTDISTNFRQQPPAASQAHQSYHQVLQRFLDETKQRFSLAVYKGKPLAALRTRLAAIGNFLTKNGDSAFSINFRKTPQVKPSCVVITPVFVDRHGNMGLLASKDYGSTGYSTAYGGGVKSTQSAEEAYVAETCEEAGAGFFDNPSPQNKGNPLRQKIAAELQRLKTLIKAPTYHSSTVTPYFSNVSWGHTTANDHSILNGVMFMPTEVLGVDAIDATREEVVASLENQFQHAKNTLTYDYFEREGFTLVPLGKFLSETKLDPKQPGRKIPQDRSFGVYSGHALIKDRFGGNNIPNVLAPVFRAIGLPYPQYQ